MLYAWQPRMTTAHLGPAPAAGRKPRYTREQIADAALRIADPEGFDAVTMKRIAADSAQRR